MDHDLVDEMHVNELKNYLKVHGLKISGNKNELVACVFPAVEKNVLLVKTAVEVEENLKKEYEKKLREDDRLITGLVLTNIVRKKYFSCYVIRASVVRF